MSGESKGLDKFQGESAEDTGITAWFGGPRLIAAMEIGAAEQDTLVEALRKANEEIADAPTIKEIAEAIDESFKKVTGPAFGMDVELGLAEPSFQAIVRALRILLTNVAMTNGFFPVFSAIFAAGM